MSQIIDNYQQVRRRITAALSLAPGLAEPHVLAVSKKQAVEKIAALAAFGHTDFGESYVQEAVQKMQQLSQESIVWHFIGPIQSNKVKLIAQHFAWVHSVDRMKLVDLFIKHRSAAQQSLNVLLQLKIGDESSKSGANVNEVYAMAAVVAAADNLSLRGLMCIPPPSTDFEQQKHYFMAAKKIFDQLKADYPRIDTLSMGMSGDLEAAIACGTTMVRVGTDIFGPRT